MTALPYALAALLLCAWIVSEFRISARHSGTFCTDEKRKAGERGKTAGGDAIGAAPAINSGNLFTGWGEGHGKCS
jgi:hypothetical protein